MVDAVAQDHRTADVNPAVRASGTGSHGGDVPANLARLGTMQFLRQGFKRLHCVPSMTFAMQPATFKFVLSRFC